MVGTVVLPTGEAIVTLYEQWLDEYGLVIIQVWPEGLVVWVGGEIRWKSWKKE